MSNKTLIVLGFLLLLFVVRLFSITHPPIESTHNWRQATVLMIARNYYEDKSTLCYPRVDENGGAIVALELPLLSFAHAKLADFFGYQHWYSRLINLIISTLGVFYFFVFLKRYANEKIAMYASLSLAISIWFMFSRKAMADTMAMSLAIMSIYYGFQFFFNKTKSSRYLIAYLVLCAFALLAKIPVIYAFIIFLWPLFMTSVSYRKKLAFVAVSIIPLLLAFYWYQEWGVYLSTIDNSWRNMGSPIIAGWIENMNHFSDFLERFTFSSFHSFVAFGCYLIGLFFLIKKNKKRYWGIFILLSLAFLLLIGKSGWMFHHHNYYIIPFVPVMAFVVGYALSQINYRYLAGVLMLAIVVESFLNQQHDLRWNEKNAYKLELSDIAESIIPANSKIITNNQNPIDIYFAHREGWAVPIEDATQANLNYLQTLPADFLIIIKKEADSHFDLPVAFENEYYRIYQL